MHSYIRPNTYVCLRLPSGVLKVTEIVPNTIISIGKYGSFPTNLLIGRPYHVTFELVELEHDEKNRIATQLRIVPASELHADAITEPTASVADSREEKVEITNGGVEFDIVGENGEVLMRNNRLTVDDASRQALTYEEIEELKKAGSGSGKDIIAKIMASHNALDEKTSFSLAKYTLRKSKKYMKRVTILPLDVAMLVNTMLDIQAVRIMEVREEILGLINSWANIHYGGSQRIYPSEDGSGIIGGGRWLCIDDTGGILVASLAERMGILYSGEDDENGDWDEDQTEQEQGAHDVHHDVAQEQPENTEQPAARAETQKEDLSIDQPPRRRRNYNFVPEMSAKTNTLTVIHSAAQPNLGLLKYFGYDTSATVTTHPFYQHLKTISWLQLLHPEEDAGYEEPEEVSPDTLASWKAGKRGTYYRKRRRWEKVTRVVNETRAGGFDGIVIASTMDIKDILKHTVPLLRGGAQVVVYSPNVESLAELMDLYSKDRKAPYMQEIAQGNPIDETDFPVNPTLLLGPMLQTVRARQWQVLPGRTHPMMMSRGLAEGYLFTAMRVFPVDGKVEARGRFTKKRKTAPEDSVPILNGAAKKTNPGEDDTSVLDSPADGDASMADAS
ncbi:adenine-N(1)--methyltransferase non-catalytic subunit trm6 [Pseudovirgaria hyperparasitica]|uniref:tRNA (adenine(58)-N(1))-methyltransferase non-catalytic subunit TRM6 n=1 Tax=Pseudovirgaria hyperparasitica TaxID=470096 RepID=A0A6A6W2B5_9PEZI|nr:adenine-N(1)--methyltransferase non-catalytic subunit trm6 [Pseudovirgaria hyperparasitica]KAF2756090.1 adenine-N(1)--methyltransferase non-catalytic subunit trm6 [Pseudovirgaria hyperparasitica]